MNRSAAVAMDLAEFFIANKINPIGLTQKKYEELNPPFRPMRLKLYFGTFARAMAITVRYMDRLNSRTPAASEGRAERLAQTRAATRAAQLKAASKEKTSG